MTSSIKFSPQPGAYERHLQRKYQNPLFPTSDKASFAIEVAQAREKDQQDFRAFLEAFETTVQETAELAGSVESEILLDLKEKLERLYVHATSLSGDLDQYSQALLKLIEVCMTGIRNSAKDDPMALKKLDEETMARQVYFELLTTPLVADLMRGDEIIQQDELIARILSEAEADLPRVMELFEPEHQQHILAAAKELVAKLNVGDREAFSIDNKLETIKKIIAVN